MHAGIYRWFGMLILAFASTSVSALELKPTRVAENVYAVIGPTGPRSYENYGLNTNLGFVVTGHGVLLIDSGATVQSGPFIARAVAGVTKQPIRWVINTGSQDHRWLGNGYFRDRGAQVIALERTVRTQREFAEQHLSGLKKVLRERLAGTEPVYADRILPGDSAKLQLGGTDVVVRWFGDAHFPGDAVVWLPERRVAFTGDLVYLDRMLGILPWSNVRSWRQAFHAFAALDPKLVVPGHGRPGDMAKVRRDTGDYLDWLITEVGGAVEQWEPLADTVERLADAPQFAHLEHFSSWHRTNINRTYLQMESQ
jgi:glyoxylase-like metal-dependent hydrolase (beta-lactamase superfamily II)